MNEDLNKLYLHSCNSCPLKRSCMDATFELVDNDNISKKNSKGSRTQPFTLFQNSLCKKIPGRTSTVANLLV